MSIAILNLHLAHDNQANVVTVRDYLKQLLIEVWDKGESFSGKRPFGNSGWEYDLYYVLVKNGYVTGYINQYGEVEDANFDHANRLIFDAIRSL